MSEVMPEPGRKRLSECCHRRVTAVDARLAQRCNSGAARPCEQMTQEQGGAGVKVFDVT